MTNKNISIAYDTALALKPKRQNMKSFHVTFGFKGNKLIGIGINDSTQFHPEKKFGRYRSTRTHNDDEYYNANLHSEIDFILKSGRLNFSLIDFFNIRIDNNDKFVLAKPCSNCLNVLRNQIGFRRIYYTTNTNTIEVIKS